MIAGSRPVVKVIVAGTVAIAKLIVSGLGLETSALTFKIACRNEPNPPSLAFVTRNGFVTSTLPENIDVSPPGDVDVALMFTSDDTATDNVALNAGYPTLVVNTTYEPRYVRAGV